jgi:ABC-type spermidine/putrescine transport system permease subunit II
VSKLLAAALPGKTIGRILSTVAPVLILAVAVLMALDQLEIAPNIVTITYASIMGAVALGMALAFGLGGRDQASRLLQGAYDLGTRPQPPDAPPTSGV